MRNHPGRQSDLLKRSASTDLPSGKVYYVTITDVLGISGLDFHSDAGERFNDGYGIDRFTTAVPPPHVPEPGSLLILGAGLVGLAARRRHSARA